MKYSRIVLIMVLALALTSMLPVVAQDERTDVEYTFNGAELQRLENGVIVQAWTMPNSLETWRTLAIMQARSQANDLTIRYTFDNDRMYHLRDNQVVGLWLLRGGGWIDEPALIVRYDYNGRELQRFVNDKLQQAWTLPAGKETHDLMVSMQAQANELVAAHVNEELHLQTFVEHLTTLLAPNFTLHYASAGQSPDMTWYSSEVGETLANVLPATTNDPVVLAMEDLVVIHEPAISTSLFDLLNIPSPTVEPSSALYDLYRLQDGKVTDIWLGYDLATLIQTAN
jgi:hypothetical protein